MFPFLEHTWADRDVESAVILQDLENFPYEKYQELMAAYRESEAWFTGAKLDKRNKKNVEIYPLKVNPIINTCLKHAYMLFGEPQDDGRPQVYPRLISRTNPDGKAAKAAIKKLISTAEDALNQVWSQSGGRALLIESGILSQLYGGTVLKVNWNGWERDPSNDLNQCRVEAIGATSFYGIPYPGNYYRLKEAWIIKKLEDSQASGLGYDPIAGEDNWHIEHWTEKKYSQRINGEYLTKTVKGKPVPLFGQNKLGLVPIVYIPHIRVGTFIGINTFDHLVGLVKEINLRAADYGDAVSEDSHSNIGMRNVSGTPEVKNIGGNLDVIDIGSARNLTGSEPEPDLFEISTSNKASQAMAGLSEVLYDQYRRDASHPSVADGEDEGSQRSGLTIAMRFWPMTSHVGTERYFWTPALDQIDKIILKMLLQHKKGGIEAEHLKLTVKQKWAPLLPRDREADVQEWVQRMSGNIGSIDTMLEATGDIEDIEEEKLKILDWIERVAEITARITAKYTNVVNEESPTSGSKKTKDSKKKTEKDDKVKPNSD